MMAIWTPTHQNDILLPSGRSVYTHHHQSAYAEASDGPKHAFGRQLSWRDKLVALYTYVGMSWESWPGSPSQDLIMQRCHQPLVTASERLLNSSVALHPYTKDYVCWRNCTNPSHSVKNMAQLDTTTTS